MRIVGSIACVALFTFGCARTLGVDHAHFAYRGEEGPARWGSLSPAWAACATGKQQSPIDLASPKLVSLPPLTVDESATTFTLENNGHTVQARPARPGTVTVGGVSYALEQFHAHHPSEHTVSGERFPLELHLVHKDPAGKALVLGILVREGPSNEALEPLWSKLPGSGVATVGEVSLAGVIPSDRRYQTYRGSLTTPPCTEGLTWVVLREAITMSSAQIDAFARLFPDNSRPVQPLGDRTLEESTP
jgi:carbonic anhydrase